MKKNKCILSIVIIPMTDRKRTDELNVITKTYDLIL
jgi:hypothetical protein